jgi:hypothetical protein
MDEGGDTIEKETAAYYLCWQVPVSAKSGAVSGKVAFTIGGESIEIPYAITVHKACLADAGRLQSTNWYNIENIGKYDGIPMHTDVWYEAFRKVLILMRRTRQTHIFLPLTAIHVNETTEGVYRFDFSCMEKMIRIALDIGFQTLELGHLAVKNYVNQEKYWLFYRPDGKKIYADSPEGYNFLAQFLPQWAGFLKERNWYDISIQHIGDEPVDYQIYDYRTICGITRKFMSGMKLFDAVCNIGLAGAMDYWVLQNHEYQNHAKEYEGFRALGDEIWMYTCCAPTGIWLNRLLDGALLKPRLLHYGNYKYNLPGYLHWGFNYFQKDIAGLRQEGTCGLSSDKIHYWPAGDTNICYPGAGKGPWMSVRAERMRTGCEDCDLLWTLAEKNKIEADTLCSNVMRAFDDYTADVKKFDDNYIKLLEAVDKL